MGEVISCPQCEHKVDYQAHTCEHCGVDLALAALLAEYSFTADSQDSQDFKGHNLAPEVLVPKLGNYFIEKEILTKEELSRALVFQNRESKKGHPQLIGQTLVDLGLISKETLDLAVTEQILSLQSALQLSNEHLEQRVAERTRELEHAMTRLAELNQLKSNFIANISHELRTPLTHIRGYLDLLIEEDLGAITSQQADALYVMANSEERLANLIDDLIQFSSISSSSKNIRLEVINLQDIFNQISVLAIENSNDNGIIWDTRFPEKLPLVKADSNKIQWALMHIIDNAIKFTPEGGRVQLGARIAEQKLEVFVADTGIGIAPDDIDDILEPFHQLDGSSTRKHGGTGLGLAVVRKVIEAHNSKIIVRSEIGIGSSIEFSLDIVTN